MDRVSTFALLFEAGTGKTKILIDDTVRSFLRDEIDTVVICAPNKVHRQWILEQLPAHQIPGLPSLTAVARGGTPNADWRKAIAAPKTVLRWFAINNELFSHESVETLLKPIFVPGRRVLLIVDESHDFKTPSAQGTRRLWSWSRRAVRVRIATGTSIANGYEDWYAQFRILDPDIIGCRTFAEFKTQYCVLSTFKLPHQEREFTKITGYKNRPELFRRVAPYAMSFRRADSPDMPKSAPPVTRAVALSDTQLRHYTQLAKLYMRELEDGTVKSETDANTRLLRLQQIVGGFAAGAELGDPPTRLGASWPKLDAVVDEARAITGPIIAWARFRPELAAIEEVFRKANISYTSYHGGVSSKDKDTNLERWKAGDFQALVSNPASGGVGLNLMHAADAIWYSRSFDQIERTQGLARIDRAGQTKPVRQVDLVAPDTVDEMQLKSLGVKQGRATEASAMLRAAVSQLSLL